MAKTFTATWLGDGDPQSQVIHIGGVRFIKGEPTPVPEDVSVNGVPFAGVIKGNPTFSIGADEEPVDAGEDAEKAAVMADLDAAGVRYRANASLESLRKLLPGS